MSNKEFEDIKIKIEAILFSYGEWIGVSEIMSSLGVESEIFVINGLKELKIKYENDYAFHVEWGDDNRWRMALKPEYEEVVSDLISSIEMPKNVLKVLSVIAYEQPITKTRLFEILGKSVKQEVEYLYKSKFVYYEKHGIGKYYKVSKKFFEYFKIDETENFRDKANQKITSFLEEKIVTTSDEIVEEED